MIKKLYWMLGYNNLSIILEQERKHWLLKTDNKKQIQNALTGDIFQGMLDNLGSDVVIESKKLPYKYDFISEITFGLENADKILTIANSAFPHSAGVNGMMFARITSANFPYYESDNFQLNHYKLRFDNTEECILPFGASISSSEVYADKWIKTSTPPTLMLLDPESGLYSVELELSFDNAVTNPVWYYPLTETLQPLELTDLGGGSYELATVNTDNYIGYPLFWFTCDNSNIGPTLTFTNNTNSRNEQIFFASNEGNASPYDVKVYTGVSGNNDGTPDGSSTSNYKIRCSCFNGDAFNHSDADFNRAIDPTSIKLLKNVTEYPIGFVCNENAKVTMAANSAWTFVDDSTYEIDMDYFDQNCIYGGSTAALVPAFNVHLDESIPFAKASTDVGIAGIKMGSANIASDIYPKYPYNLNKWDGLPEWLTNMDEGCVPEHNVLYAFHQPPGYDPEDPTTMQGSGLILDPGKHQTEAEPTTENVGRVYVLSNDAAEYVNNATEEDSKKKPPRTAARICDIPTSVMQYVDVDNLASGPIVDPKYVRTEASYSSYDKNLVYNTLASRWVRPSVLKYQIENYIISVEDIDVDDIDMFAFDGPEQLNLIDMRFTNFRETLNLNPVVDPLDVSISSIADGGSGYEVNDMLVCVIGGYGFTLQVATVDADGGITSFEGLGRPDGPINLANFDIDPLSTGTTQPYSTSPLSGSGRGAKIRFVIANYTDLLQKPGEYFTDLFAVVRERDGAYIYNFIIDQSSPLTPKKGTWTKGVLISQYEVTSTEKSEGGVSTQESFINSILPSLRVLPIVMKNDNEDTSEVRVLQSASFVHIVDTMKTPVVPKLTSEDENIPSNVVDLCKLHCDGLLRLRAAAKTNAAVYDALKEANAFRFDSYLIWRWVAPTNPNNKEFEYGVVYRGFNNLFTTDTETMLPTNELKCDNYVHVNGNTSVVWNVPGVGTMLWVYDPAYTKKEDYYINAETMELHVHRGDMLYDDIDIRQGSGDVIKVVEDGVFKFNVMTNNPSIITSGSSPIYQQPDMTQIINIDTSSAVVPAAYMPKGNWRLVFPRVESFTLRNDTTGTEWVPMRMQIIKGRYISDVGTVRDANNNDVSMKTLVMSDTSTGEELRIFNSATKTFEKI